MKNLSIISSPNEYFYDVFTHHIKQQRIVLDKDVEFYIVQLLSRFIKTENVYLATSSGYENSPLCLLLKEADDERSLDVKRLLFRQVGDLAIYTVGVFSAKNINNHYYELIGKMAYSSAAALYQKDNIKNLYRDLSCNFGTITRILKTIPDLILVK